MSRIHDSSSVYILNEHEQEQKIRDLALVRDEGESWERHFVEAQTGESWTLYWPRSEQHGGGPRFLRRGKIPADVAGWVAALLRSGREEDAIGAGTDLSSTPDSWPLLLERLEAERETLPQGRVRAFLVSLGILQPMNRGTILGKSPEEITADVTHFRQLANRAAMLVEPSDASGK